MELKVAFIGLGIMGAPMAGHLHEAGYLYRVYNRTQEKTKPFQELGVKAVSTPQEAAAGADVIITVVSDSSDVEQVVLGESGVIHSAKQGAVVIDMSSINPEVTKRIGAALQEEGIEMLDAPVSGGEAGAIQGTLAIMAGGKREVLDRVLPVLKPLGSSIVHVGELGAGGYAKLANQIMVALHLQAMSEAFYLAKQANLDFEVLYQAIRGGLAGSNVLEKKIGNLKESSYRPGFKIDLHLKDLKNALSAAESYQVKLPFTEKAEQLMAELSRIGLGEMDHSALYHYLSEVK